MLLGESIMGSPLTNMKSEELIPRRLLSLKETAHVLNVSQKTVRRLIDRKLLKASKALRHIRVPVEAIDQFVKQTTE
jgi:excisionase family DNA binding protein